VKTQIVGCSWKGFCLGYFQQLHEIITKTGL